MAERELTIRLRADGRGLTATVQQGARQFQMFGRQLDMTAAKSAALAKTTGTLNSSLGTLRSLLPAMGFAILVRGAVQAAEEFRTIDARIRRATAATGDYNKVSREVYEIAQRNGNALRTTADLFININRAAEDLGRSRGDVLALTDTIQQLGVISGASGEAMKNSMRQFSQAMAGGVVRAEEFNSIIENTPEIAAAIARGLGMTVGQLRLAVVEGKVLSEDVFEALLGQTDRIREEFENMPLTIGRAWNMLTNSMGRYVAMANESSGLTETLGQSIKRVSERLDEMVDSGDTRALETFAKGLGLIAENLDLIAVAIGGILAKNLFTALATRMIAVASAGSVMQGALMALGGPAGIAAIAAGGIYLLARSMDEHEGSAKHASDAQREYNRVVEAGGKAAIKATQDYIAAKYAQIEFKNSIIELGRAYNPNYTNEGLESEIGTILNDIRRLEGELGALQQGLSARAENSAAALGKVGSRTEIYSRQTSEAQAKLESFLQSMRDQAKVANLTERELYAYNAVQKAMKDGVTEGIDEVHALALKHYDEKKAIEEATRAKAEYTAASEAAAKARMEELNAMAAVEAAGWDQEERLRQMERDQTIARNQELQKRVDGLVSTLETEREAIAREYQERLRTLDQAYATDGIEIMHGYAQARERIEAEYSKKIIDLYRQEWEEKHQIVTGFIDSASRGLARYVTDTIRGEKEAKEAARSQLDERLADLDEMLREGDISVDDANKRRKKLYEDFYERLNEIEKEAAERLKDTLVNAFVDAIEQMLSEWIKRGMTNLAIRITGGTPAGGILGSSGGGIGLGDIAGLASKIGGKGIANAIGAIAGPSSWAAANAAFATGDIAAGIPGLTWATAGGQAGAATGAAAAAGAKAGAAAGAQAAGSVVSAGGSSQLLGLSGLAIPAAIFGGTLLGTSILGSRDAKEAAKYRDRMAANFGSVSPQGLGDSGASFIGAFENGKGTVDEMYVAVSEQLNVALKETGMIVRSLKLGIDEAGEPVRRMVGDVDQVKSALERAKVTGFQFAGSLETAIEKGNGLRVSIEGDAEVIKQKLEEAAAAGVGGFHNLEVTASGVSATLTGDIAQWNKTLQEFVNSALQAAVSGVGALGGAAASATGKFLALANAAAGLRAPGSGATINIPQHETGLGYVPYDNYLALLHKGERVMTAQENRQFSGGGAGTAPVVSMEPLLAEQREMRSLMRAMASNTARAAEAAERSERRMIAAGWGGRK